MAERDLVAARRARLEQSAVAIRDAEVS